MDALNTQQATQATGRYFGKYRGIVTDNEDPSNLGRLKARVPELLREVATGWALPCAPYAGNGEGQFTVPPAGAGVWIEFESGDLSLPIWSGCWWGEDQVPEDNSGTRASPPLKILRSEQGLMVTLDDNSQTISVSDRNGSNMLTIQVQQGKVTVQGTTKVVVEAPQIELVENATHPIVFGDDLLTYLTQLVTMFNTHMHLGEMAAGVLPVTPAPTAPLFHLTPPTPALLSMKVKSG